MYGARYIKRYEKEVAEMFQQGVENSSRKLGPARMVEVLIQNHPKKYDIPSENEIRAEISKLARSRRKRPREVSEASSIVGGNEEGGGLPVIQRRKPMKSCYASFLEDVVTSDPGIKPQLALQKLRLAFPLSSSELDDFKITTKVSSIKQKLKKRRNFTTPTKKRTST
ncbi:hypothetical protein PR003_g26012 [Phytophthora rubi]|uniref:Uncharacterized protein n=1 Tax=Phytophthora rubi TaxID=129364 RepID=A0A6A3IH53_9STRA|nr:hypothetical protein PR002_g24410 [Phytophthora rubi]KAE8979835.1 hypothetical protein PR001_g24440 [Phytophthora rubi]KAE9287609.1 hypothetical protein PR003_g26012 [Phytophthora rubi]